MSDPADDAGPLAGDEVDEGELEAASPRRALPIAVGATLATTAAVGFFFAEPPDGAPYRLAAIGVTYLALATFALVRLARLGELGAALRPRGGDLTLGAVVAAVMHGGAIAGHLLLMPRGSPREAWIVRVYLALGDPTEANMHLVGGVVLVIAALEELVWRGLVMRALEDAYGTLRAWLWSTAFFAVARLPIVYFLRDPTAGLNPVLPLAALGCGLVWGYLASRTGRLAPAVFAHALFSWSIVEFPLWRP
jgi:membrane protease YdiL (CAAX protease family)